MQPEDTTATDQPGTIRCADIHYIGTMDWVCTRRADHPGRHAAGDGQQIRATWTQDTDR